ncbi:MAG: AAA family ATPase, partial [Oligoflexales bacterium]|nr:AAA family ATPase [Oligoflexales bacterium]
RRKPYSVILFDEIEKAHPDVFHILLQILDDGRVTDNQGHTINFKNTIIIMTSNIGAARLMEGITENGEILPGVRENVEEELRLHFRPEFLNRVDDIIIFKPLIKDEIQKIVDLIAEDLRKRLAGQEIGLKITDSAKILIADRAYDPVYGARPLKRFFQKQIETKISKAIIAGKFAHGETITVDVCNNELDLIKG